LGARTRRSLFGIRVVRQAVLMAATLLVKECGVKGFRLGVKLISRTS
jgi:hypothetical protein